MAKKAVYRSSLKTPEAITEAREAGLEKTALVISLRKDIEVLNKRCMELEAGSSEQELAKKGKRIVAMTDVTTTRDVLVRAIVKSGKLPGNEIPAFADLLLKEMILGA